MKTELQIPVQIGYCKKCFRNRRSNSSYCGKCQDEPEKMKIYTDIQQNFPLINLIKETFPITDRTILTYGDTIYYNYQISFDLVAHEIIHVFQQTKMGAEKWWKKYLEDTKFRLQQEVEAYHRQYKVMNSDEKWKAAILLEDISKELGGKLYGNIVSYEEAKKLISKL